MIGVEVLLIALLAAVAIACVAWVGVITVAMAGSVIFANEPRWKVELGRMRERGEVPARVTDGGDE